MPGMSNRMIARRRSSASTNGWNSSRRAPMPLHSSSGGQSGFPSPHRDPQHAATDAQGCHVLARACGARPTPYHPAQAAPPAVGRGRVNDHRHMIHARPTSAPARRRRARRGGILLAAALNSAVTVRGRPLSGAAPPARRAMRALTAETRASSRRDLRSGCRPPRPATPMHDDRWPNARCCWSGALCGCAVERAIRHITSNLTRSSRLRRP